MSFSITRNGITVEGTSMIPVFQEMARLQEVFMNDSCGKCGNSNVRMVVRPAKDKKGKEHDYHEMRCQNPTCRARLCFGVTDDGLFPKRKDEDGTYLPHNGWVIWDKEKQKNV